MFLRTSPVAIRFLIVLSAATTLIVAMTASSFADERAEPASANPLDKTAVRRYAEAIDAILEKQLQSNGETFNGKISDEEFVRRVYLEAIGRIPSLDETEMFLDSRKRDKRARLIDDLLDSYGYVSRQFNFWSDILRIKTRNNKAPGEPYIDFVKDSLEQNLPYDEFVSELITAEGSLYEPGNGSVGYYLRDRNMPEDNMSNTVRIFLGTRLECAQCHDHPFDKWTQRQYFEMVAFTGGIRYQDVEAQEDIAPDMRQLRRTASDDPDQVRLIQRASNLLRTLTAGVSGSGTGLTKLPEHYKGSDGKENEIIAAREMFGGEALVDVEVASRMNRPAKKKKKKSRQQSIRNAKDVHSRDALADWITNDDNPRFATVIANRLWKQAFGLGLIEPVDVIEDQTKASNPELMDYLTEMMRELDYDMQDYLRVIYNTRAWQSAATGDDVIDPEHYRFAGPIMRRMSAEQMWDSMTGLIVDEIDVRLASPKPIIGFLAPDESVYDIYETIREMDADEILEFVAERTGKNRKTGGAKKGTLKKGESREIARQQRRRNAMQMMTQMSGEEVPVEAMSRRDQARSLARQTKELQRMIRKAQQSGDTQTAKRLSVERTELVAKFRRQGDSGYRRASELESPTRPGHFLRQFGQSDREQIENANSESAVTQALTMMNGIVDQKIVRDTNSVLMRNILLSRNPADSINAIYLTILTRHPHPQEIAMWLPEIRRDPKTAYADLAWTLTNSNEFLFVR